MDNRRLLIAALLSLIVVVAWQALVVPTKPPPVSPEAEEISSPALPPQSEGEVQREPGAEAPTEAVESVEPAPLAAEPIAASAERSVTLETAHVEARFTNRGAQLVSFHLKERPGPDGEPLELVRPRASGDPYPFALVTNTGEPLPFQEVLFQVAEETTGGGGRAVVFHYRGEAGEVVKRFAVDPESVFMETRVETRGVAAGWGILQGPDVREVPAKTLASRTYQRWFSYLKGDDFESLNVKKLGESQTISGDGLVWLGLEDNYFLTALVPESPVDSIAVISVPLVHAPAEEEVKEEGEEEAEPTTGALAVVMPQDAVFEGLAYWGPKEYDTLKAEPYGLERSIRWGIFKLLARPLLFLLLWIHEHVVQNFGWAIILTTVLVKIVLFPLTHKSYVSMQKLQKLNPRMEAIRQKYRPKLKDKQGRPNVEMQRKMNEEMQSLFREEGVNPAGGCLPILLQIPVFIAFFNLLRSAVELWNAPFILWIKDLSEPDPYYVIPLVMGATQVLQQRMTPPPPNPSQQMVMRMMPIVFTFFSLGFPSGLVLYWLTNNVLTIIQQGGYNRLKKAGYFGGEEPDAKAGTSKTTPPKGRSQSGVAPATKRAK